MLVKIKFPHEALILSGMGEVIFNFTVRLVLMIIVFVWFRVAVSWTILLAPFGILALMMLGLTIGILLTPLGMLYHDILRGLGLITRMWFFVTPVIYPPPTKWPVSLLVRVNPVSPLLITTRELLTTGRVSHPNDFWLVMGITFLLMFVGWVLYRLSMPHLIERMGR